MHRFSRIDFTDGNIVVNVILFSLPIIAGELLQNLYNSVDALVVGNFVGGKALAAVMVCGIISGMLVNFFNGMSVGANVVVAKSFGRGDTAQTDRAIARRVGKGFLSFGEVFRSGRQVVVSILQIGVAAGMQSALIGISNLFVVRYINYFNTASVAGIGIAQRLDKFIVLPVKSFGITMTTYVGQNLGAMKYDRIRKGKSRCLALGLIMTLALSFIVFLFVDQCVSLFNSDPEVVRVGREMLHVLLPCFWIMAVREIYTGILRGYGHATMPMILSLCGMVVFRQIFLAFTMRQGASIRIIYICYPLAWAVAMILILIYYRSVRNSLPGLEHGIKQAGN